MDTISVLSRLQSPDIEVAVGAAEEVHHISTISDVPFLLTLLEHSSFFVREAAAWPLANLGVVTSIPELLVSYQRGFEDGHDNDGFTAALIEMAELHPIETRNALSKFIESAQEPMLGHAKWLVGFCGVA